jgi:hypothetical protein
MVSRPDYRTGLRRPFDSCDCPEIMSFYGDKKMKCKHCGEEIHQLNGEWYHIRWSSLSCANTVRWGGVDVVLKAKPIEDEEWVTPTDEDAKRRPQVQVKQDGEWIDGGTLIFVAGDSFACVDKRGALSTWFVDCRMRKESV